MDIGQHPTIPVPEYQNGIPVLESLPGARGVIYLDFDGETTTQWGDGSLIVARKPSLTASQIREIWRHVAADYPSFPVNLTTEQRELLEQFEATFVGEHRRRHSPKSSTFLDGVQGFWDRMVS